MLCFVSYTIYTIWPVRSRGHCTVSIMNHMGVTPASDLAIGSRSSKESMDLGIVSSFPLGDRKISCGGPGGEAPRSSWF